MTTGVGIASAAAAGKALASICSSTTAGQPLGPFFPGDGTPKKDVRESPSGPIAHANDNDLTWVRLRNGNVSERADGQIVHVKGKILDSACRPISGAVVVIWQASSTGGYNHQGDGANLEFVHPKTGKTVKRLLDPNFQYWGKAVTDADGAYHFKTVVPGFYPADLRRGWFRPPHIHYLVSALGHSQFVTQSYFSGKHLEDANFISELNQKDFLLQNPKISEEDRKKLVVKFEKSKTGRLEGVFDITLPS